MGNNSTWKFNVTENLTWKMWFFESMCVPYWDVTDMWSIFSVSCDWHVKCIMWLTKKHRKQVNMWLRLTTVAVYTDAARNSWNFPWIACSMLTQSSPIFYSKWSFSRLPQYHPLCWINSVNKISSCLKYQTMNYPSIEVMLSSKRN